MQLSQLLFLGTALVLGLRHGIDWDHIAAITDISGSQTSKKDSFLNGLSYALGHATVIIILGLLAIIVGIQLPEWVDTVMEPIVGVTLVALGIWLLGSIIVHGKNFKLMSRWMLLARGIRRLVHGHSHNELSKEIEDGVGFKSAFGVGMVHGIGAETPTQLLIFVTAAGVGGKFVGSLLVLSFVVGLVISNTIITLLSIYGFSGVQKNPTLYLGLGSISGIFSLIVGILFLTGNGTILPAILGG
jgi:high-affinity nickel permease